MQNSPGMDGCLSMKTAPEETTATAAIQLNDEPECLICLCPIDASRCWQCDTGHLFCADCLVAFVRIRMQARKTTFSCPGPVCVHQIDEGCLSAVLPEESRVELAVLQRKQQDPSLCECLRCSNLVDDEPSSSYRGYNQYYQAKFCFTHRLLRDMYEAELVTSLV
jgi:hypothetical protein